MNHEWKSWIHNIFPMQPQPRVSTKSKKAQSILTNHYLTLISCLNWPFLIESIFCRLLHLALISRNHNLWTHAQTFSVSCSDWSLRTLHISLENKSLAVIISAVMFGKINELRYENWFNQKLGDNNVYIRDNSFLSTIVYSNANSTSAALISL